MSGDNEHGLSAEVAARDVAARLGLPDFVYTVPQLNTKSGSREVGDALIIVDGVGDAITGRGLRSCGFSENSECFTTPLEEEAQR
jgi:hypothetical protein